MTKNTEADALRNYHSFDAGLNSMLDAALREQIRITVDDVRATIELFAPCRCDDAYKDRDLEDPGCQFHDVMAALDEVAALPPEPRTPESQSETLLRPETFLCRRSRNTMTRTGSLSRQHRSGKDMRPRTVNRNPLRKVIRETVNEEGYPREELECGHLIVPPRDFIGETVASRRRCWRCRTPGEER